MKSFIRFLLTLLSLAFICSCSNIPSPYQDFDDTITVRLIEDERFEIKSDNPTVIKKGDDATFEVLINEDYEFDKTSEGTFEDGVYRIAKVKRSRNISMKVIRKGNFHLNIVNDSNFGTYTVFPQKTAYELNEQITIDVTPRTGCEFMCFTKTNPFRPKSEWDPSGKPLSFVSTYSFSITQDLTIHINYFSTDNLLRIKYYSNGGKTIDNDNKIVLDYSIPVQFTSPSTMLGTHYLFREGYTLESYNTKQDGSGHRVGIGSAADISYAENNEIVLYAQWAKWNDYSDFLIEEDEHSCSIKEYTGNKKASVIVVPDEYNKKKIASIASNAFYECDMTKLLLNEHLSVLEENAVNNCEKLVELLAFTNLVTATDKSVVSESLTCLKINRTVYPYSILKRDRDISGQIQTLKQHDNKVIFFGMSTMRYNHPLDVMKEKWPNKFFYLAGMQAGCNYKLSLDIVEKTMKPSDKIFFSMYETSLPPDGGGGETFTYLQHNFDLLSDINYQKHKRIIFNQFASYDSDTIANQGDDIYPNQKFNGYDKNGMVVWGPETDNEKNVDAAYKPHFENYQKKQCVEWIQDVSENNFISENNLIICWSSYNRNSVIDSSIFVNFENFVLLNVHFPFFDSILDNIYPGDLFRENDSIHLSLKGGRNRMEQWSGKIGELII